MIKTNTFVKSLLDKGLVDDVAFVKNGYDIQVQGKLTSVRFNDKGGAILWNHRSNPIEIESGRLDDVLHRYIVRSCFGTQNKVGVHGIKCNDTFLVPTKVINNCVIFTDTLDRNYVVSNTTAEAALSYFKEAASVNADDVMIMLNNFKAYSTANRREIKSSIEDVETETRLLKCSVCIDDYSVTPNSTLINNVGQTIVGNFLCSSADKLNAMTFEEDEAKVFCGNAVKHNITSSTVRTKNPFALRAQVALKSAACKKAVNEYLNAKYPTGLSLKAVESALAYEAGNIFKAAGIHEPLSYENVFNHFRKDGEKITFRLDSNKSLFSAIEVEGVSVQKFRSIPDVETIKNALYREGYSISELESGLTFNTKDDVVTSIVNSCKNFVPVTEKVMNEPNTITKLIGIQCHKELATYGIEDKNKVFNSIVKVVIN